VRIHFLGEVSADFASAEELAQFAEPFAHG